MYKKQLNWHARKTHCRQTLSAEDCDIRMEFTEITLAWHEDSPDLFKISFAVMNLYFTSLGLETITTVSTGQMKILVLHKKHLRLDLR